MYHAPKQEVDPQAPRRSSRFLVWDTLRVVAGIYLGFEHKRTRFSAEPKRLHQIQVDGTPCFFFAPTALEDMLTESLIGQRVVITYQGTRLTRRGYQCKRFKLAVNCRVRGVGLIRDGVLNPASDDEAVPF